MDWLFLNRGEKMKIKLFIAAPISSFDNELDYIQLREKLLQIISRITDIFNDIQITSELIQIQSLKGFESPAISAKKDFLNIKECTHFIIFYPRKIVSSALIELGYAIALDKNILIITPNKETLPYMAQELNSIYETTRIEFLEDILKFEEVVLKFLV